jgi:hypothetical protein
MTPDFFSALTGWRKFDIANGGKLLTSAGHIDHAWPVANLGEAYCGEAYCRANWYESPAAAHEAPELT